MENASGRRIGGSLLRAVLERGLDGTEIAPPVLSHLQRLDNSRPRAAHCIFPARIVLADASLGRRAWPGLASLVSILTISGPRRTIAGDGPARRSTTPGC